MKVGVYLSSGRVAIGEMVRLNNKHIEVRIGGRLHTSRAHSKPYKYRTGNIVRRGPKAVAKEYRVDVQRLLDEQNERLAR